MSTKRHEYNDTNVAGNREEERGGGGGGVGRGGRGGGRIRLCPSGLVVRSLSLLVTGIVLSIIGIYWVANKAQKHHGGVAFILIGIVTIVAGSYGAGEALGQRMGWRGYDEVMDGNDDSDFEFARL